MARAGRQLTEAKAALERAREKLRLVKQAEAANGSAAAAASAAPQAAPARLGVSRSANRDQTEAQRREEEARAAATRAADKTRRQREMLALRPLGTDHEGTNYWHLPDPPSPDGAAKLDDDGDGEESAWQPRAPSVFAERTTVQGGLRRSDGWVRPNLAELVNALSRSPNQAGDASLLRRILALKLPACEPDSSDEEELALKEARGRWKSAGPHVGARVSRIIRGVTYNGTITRYQPPPTERANGDSSASVSAAPAWCIRYDDGDEEELGEADVAEARREAGEAPCRSLRRAFAAAAAELQRASSALPPGVPRLGDEWFDRANVATTPAEFGRLAVELHEAAWLASRPASLDADAAELHEAERKLWRSRLAHSATMPQLAMRCDEIRYTLFSRPGLSFGALVDVNVRDSESKVPLWKPAHVIAVWPDASFRVCLEVDDDDDDAYETFDFAAVSSREGRKALGTLWRRPPSPYEGSSDDNTPADDVVAAVAVGDSIQVLHLTDGTRKRAWVGARVTKVMRGNAFTAQAMAAAAGKTTKYRHEDHGSEWRWP